MSSLAPLHLADQPKRPLAAEFGGRFCGKMHARERARASLSHQALLFQQRPTEVAGWLKTEKGA